jgi:hypothetical protein
LEIFEILASANRKRKPEETLRVLNEHRDNQTLHYILQGSYDNNVKSYLPPGKPPFTPFPEKDPSKVPSTLNFQQRKIFNLFEYSWGSKQPRVKMEREFIAFLESVHAEDADILIRMKDKTLEEKYPKLTKDVVREFLRQFGIDIALD